MGASILLRCTDPDTAYCTHDPYDKIGFGEGRAPYKNMVFEKFAIFPMKNKVVDHVWLLYTSVSANKIEAPMYVFKWAM